jgi:hypothetical protein
MSAERRGGSRSVAEGRGASRRGSAEGITEGITEGPDHGGACPSDDIRRQLIGLSTRASSRAGSDAVARWVKPRGPLLLPAS